MNISDIILAVIILFIVTLPYLILPLIKRLPEKQLAALDQFAKYAVQKVEQQFVGNNLQKKDLAVHIIETCFKAAKLPLPELVLVDAAVESFVYEIKQLAGPSSPPEPPSISTGPLPVPPTNA